MKWFYSTILLLYIFLSCYSQTNDVQLLRIFHSTHDTQFDKPMQLVSNTTSYIAIGIPVGLAVTGLYNRDTNMFMSALKVATALFTAGVITYTLKYSVNRPRPFISYPQYFIKKSDGGSPSFPSGHTSAAFSVATAISLEYKKWYIVVPAFTWATTVAYSRMHLGVHYPSDVIIGAIIGSSCAIISYQANKWLREVYYKKK